MDIFIETSTPYTNSGTTFVFKMQKKSDLARLGVGNNFLLSRFSQKGPCESRTLSVFLNQCPETRTIRRKVSDGAFHPNTIGEAIINNYRSKSARTDVTSKRARAAYSPSHSGEREECSRNFNGEQRL